MRSWRGPCEVREASLARLAPPITDSNMMTGRRIAQVFVCTAVICTALGLLSAAGPQQGVGRVLSDPPRGASTGRALQDAVPAASSRERALLDRYCVTCHNDKL